MRYYYRCSDDNVVAQSASVHKGVKCSPPNLSSYRRRRHNKADSISGNVNCALATHSSGTLSVSFGHTLTMVSQTTAKLYAAHTNTPTASDESKTTSLRSLVCGLSFLRVFACRRRRSCCLNDADVKFLWWRIFYLQSHLAECAYSHLTNYPTDDDKCAGLNINPPPSPHAPLTCAYGHRPDAHKQRNNMLRYCMLAYLCCGTECAEAHQSDVRAKRTQRAF